MKNTGFCRYLAQEAAMRPIQRNAARIDQYAEQLYFIYIHVQNSWSHMIYHGINKRILYENL